MEKVNFKNLDNIRGILSNSATPEYSDVRLISANRECVFINRLVLSSCSSFLKSVLLQSQPENSEAFGLNVKDFQTSTLSNFREFVTSGLSACPNETEYKELNQLLSTLGIDLIHGSI